MLAALLLTTAVSMAADPSCPVGVDAIRGAAQETLGLYDQFEFDAFHARFDQLVAELQCAQGPLSRADAFQVYQLQGLDALVAEDRDRMVAALRAMIAVRPDYTLPEDLAAPGSTMAEAYAAAKQAELVAGQALRAEGAWYIDGVMGVTELPVDRAVLVQHQVEGAALETWLLDGGRQPESLAVYLPTGGGKPLVIPPRGVGESGSSGRHLSRTLALSGAASAAVAVAGFAVAGSAYKRFPDESNRSKAQSLEGLNHGASIAGGVFAVAGGGLLAGAVIRGEW